MPTFSSILGRLCSFLSPIYGGIEVTLALFSGFWWLLPFHIQTQFGLPSNKLTPGWILLVLYAGVFNFLPMYGMAFVRRQRYFGLKVRGLIVCTAGYLVGFLA